MLKRRRFYRFSFVHLPEATDLRVGRTALDPSLRFSDTLAKVSKDDLHNDLKCVYLSPKLDRFFIDRAVHHRGGEGLVVVVRAKRQSLEADENALAPSDLEVLAADDALWLSLRFGQCKHRGMIPRSQISGIYGANGDRIA